MIRYLLLFTLAFASLNPAQAGLSQWPVVRALSCLARLGANKDSAPKAVAEERPYSPVGLDLYPAAKLARFVENAKQLKRQGDGPVLTMVIPAYKEGKRIAQSMAAMKEFLDAHPWLDAEVLVIVEHPPEDLTNTLTVGRDAVGNDPRIEVIDNEVWGGKGFAVRSGMKRAKGDYVIFMDTDLSTPLVEVLSFLSRFQEDPGIDVLVGNRKNDQSSYTQNRGLFRKVLSLGFIKIREYIVGLKNVSDTQCGFKAFKQKASRDVFNLQQINGFSFDLEALLLAEKLGFRIEEENVHWKDEPENSTVGRWAWVKMLQDMLKVKGLVRTTVESSILGEDASAP